MLRLNAAEIARLLNEFGRRAMLYGGNPYRAKAYIRAAERLALLAEPIDSLIAQNRLKRYRALVRRSHGLSPNSMIRARIRHYRKCERRSKRAGDADHPRIASR
jgi:DNA polymerase/3'-5' exonuclease PolX